MNEPLPPSDEKTIACTPSAGFAAWMAAAGGSVAISTYQAGKMAMVGWNGQQITLLMRHFPKPMGMAIQGQKLALACRHELWIFANASLLAHDYPENNPGSYDALFMPRVAYFTGDLYIHDLAYASDGLWMVNTRFSCLGSLSEDFSFVPRWQPPFISMLAPEDRCHLNGLALKNGRPKYVTALGQSDEPGGWRPSKVDGGILMDLDGEILLRGLCMPHSPRWHDDRLWILNSGNGELCVADLQRGEWTTVCALPGYLRGLCFTDHYALVGLSQVRERRVFDGLPIQQRHEKLLCGVAVVDLKSGTVEGLLEFTAGCQELYDVHFMPGIYRPNVLNSQREVIRQAITAPEFSYWLQPRTESPPNSPAGS